MRRVFAGKACKAATLSNNSHKIWVLLDDQAGNRAQALGVVAALGLPVREIEIRYAGFAKIPNLLLGASVAGLNKASQANIKAPWPDMVIAAGRRTAPVARWIKAQSDGHTRLVQIMDPGAGRAAFDLICRPAHDEGKPADNIITINAAPHRFTDAKLREARAAWEKHVAKLPTPRIAVMIGGSTRKHTFTDAMALELIMAAERAADAVGGSLMVTTSRRTGRAVDTIEMALTGPHVLHRWDSDDDNPYVGFLALASAIIVTGESVSMCSEACATGRSVYLFAPPGLISDKHARLHSNLIAGAHARPFEGTLDLGWQPERLDVASEIAAEIRVRGFVA